MHNVRRNNVNQMVSELCWILKTVGCVEKSRNGTVLTVPEPVMATFYKPKERVLFWPERDANPYFHLMEALWMLAGRRDVEFPTRFNSKFGQYSDDGIFFNGAYGWRWRNYWNDQLHLLVRMLKEEPTTRRAVLGMWDPHTDLWSNSKDIPCNTHVYWRSNGHVLDMTVCNRSNDLVWGLCGSNVVHFSMLHEFVAHGAGLLVGTYHHFTNNLHLYDDVPNRHLYSTPDWNRDPYREPGGVSPYPLCTIGWEEWLEDCRDFVDGLWGTLRDPFFRNVAVPIAESWYERKRGNGDGRGPLGLCLAEDWKRACLEWLGRRDSKV
jgi:hypothetical protein